MPIRSLLLLNTRKSCHNQFRFQIRYASNLTKDNEKNKSGLVKRILKRYPRLASVYEIVIGGFRELLNDGKKFLKVTQNVAENEKGIANLNLEDLLFYRQFNQNLTKIVPLALLAILPFGNGIIVPLVYFYPRELVTPHFWTEKQKATFPQQEFQNKLKHHEPLLKIFNDCPSSKIPDHLLSDWRSLVSKLQTGMQPEPSEILNFEPLFDYKGVFYLHDLSSLHLSHLAGAYGLSKFLPLGRLIAFARTNLVIDKKIEEAGGPKKLSSEIRSQICFMRGVNSMNMKEEEKILFLEKWLIVNQETSLGTRSLLLHTPLLLGYSHLNRRITSTKV